MSLIVTRGFGPGGNVSLIVTRGFSIGIPPTAINKIKMGVVAWIRSVLGDPAYNVIYMRRNAPRPIRPYFAFDIISHRQVGQDAVWLPDELNYRVPVLGNREFTLTIQGYGPGVYENALELRDSLEIPEVHNAFKAYGFFPFNWEPVLNITGLDNSEFEERVSFDLFCRTDKYRVYTSDIIETVEGAGRYKNPPKSDIVEQYTVTVQED